MTDFFFHTSKIVLKHWESTESESKIKPCQQWCYLLCHFCDLVCPNSLSSINNNCSAPVFIIKIKTGISMSDSIFCVKQHYITTASQHGILQKKTFHVSISELDVMQLLHFWGISSEQHRCEVTCLFVHLLHFPWATHALTSLASKILTLLTLPLLQTGLLCKSNYVIIPKQHTQQFNYKAGLFSEWLIWFNTKLPGRK